MYEMGQVSGILNLFKYPCYMRNLLYVYLHKPKIMESSLTTLFFQILHPIPDEILSALTQNIFRIWPLPIYSMATTDLIFLFF